MTKELKSKEYLMGYADCLFDIRCGESPQSRYETVEKCGNPMGLDEYDKGYQQAALDNGADPAPGL